MRACSSREHAGSVVGWIHVQATYLLDCDPRAEIWGLVVDEIDARNRRRPPADRSGRGMGEVARSRHHGPAIESASDRVRRGFMSISDTRMTKTQNAFRKNLYSTTV